MSRPPILLIASASDANMRYASGLSVSDPFILLDTGRRRIVLVSSLEYLHVKRELPKKKFEVHLFDEFDERDTKTRHRRASRKTRRHTLASIAVSLLKGRRVKSVVMAQNALALHVETLRSEGIRVRLQAIYPGRIIKDAREVAAICKVRDATERAMERCLGIIKRSRAHGDALVWNGETLTSETLRREARKVLLEHDCEAPELIISHGSQTASPHENGSGAIRPGEPVMLDFFPRSMTTGFHFDMTRTAVKGTPTQEYRRLWRTVLEAQREALALLKPGMKAKTVHEAAAAVFRRHGYATTAEEGFTHSTGHGLGLQIHEPPSLGVRSVERLRAGMVVTVEPGLYYNRGIGGARIEDTVLVTRTGHKNLTRTPKKLRI